MASRRPQPSTGTLVPARAGPLLDPKSRIRSTIERLFAELRPNTFRAYQHAWDVLAKYLGLRSRIDAAAHMTTLSAGEANGLAMEWMAAMRKEAEEARKRGVKGISASTMALRLAALKGVTKRLRIVELIPWTIEIRGPKVNRYKDTKGPGNEAVARVVEALRSRNDPKGIRDLAIIHALYTTGLRRGELAQLTLRSLELDKNLIWIFGKSRDDEESITVQLPAKKAIEAWLAIRPAGSQNVFVSLDPYCYGKPLSDNGIWRITTSYGLGRPHGLRHTGITRVLEKSGGNIRMAQEFSRHKDPRTLMLYDDNRMNLAGEASKLLEEDLEKKP